MSRLTDLVFKVLRIHAGDTPVKVKEAIIHPTTQSNKNILAPVTRPAQTDVVESIEPQPPITQKNNGTSNVATS